MHFVYIKSGAYQTIAEAKGIEPSCLSTIVSKTINVYRFATSAYKQKTLDFVEGFL